MADRITEIRELLAEVEDDGWHSFHMGNVPDGKTCDVVYDAAGREVASIFIDNMSDADLCMARAAFFAEAPRAIRFLLDEVARARIEERAAIVADLRDAVDEVGSNQSNVFDGVVAHALRTAADRYARGDHERPVEPALCTVWYCKHSEAAHNGPHGKCQQSPHQYQEMDDHGQVVDVYAGCCPCNRFTP